MATQLEATREKRSVTCSAAPADAQLAVSVVPVPGRARARRFRLLRGRRHVGGPRLAMPDGGLQRGAQRRGDDRLGGVLCNTCARRCKDEPHRRTQQEDLLRHDQLRSFGKNGIALQHEKFAWNFTQIISRRLGWRHGQLVSGARFAPESRSVPPQKTRKRAALAPGLLQDAPLAQGDFHAFHDNLGGCPEIKLTRL
jgi:hypothetical protein